MYKVFIVEDDPMVLSINERYVSKLSQFTVVGTARSGEEALQKIAQLQPDLVLLDIYMPEKDGMYVFRHIRQMEVQPEIIMITAVQDTDTITEALRLGVLDYIIKPYEFARLKQSFDAYAVRKATLSSSETLTQKELDKITTAPKEVTKLPTNQSLPKGFDHITLEKIREILSNAQKPLSTKKVAEKLSLSRITVRRYLEYLSDLGEINVDLEYGSMGRPTKVYSAP